MPIAARLSGVLLALLFGASVLAAQEYPSRPIRMIVPYPAGGITDILPRILGEFLTRKWGQPIVVDNRPGAAGNIAETLPGFVSSTWVGAFLPPNAPPAIADKLSRDFAEALAQPDIAKNFLDHACEPLVADIGITPE